jgi:hypothetical protein
MWTFDYPPSDYFEQEYGFRPDEEWYDHLRMSALRFASYCSASFVSEDGLIMTNHHCARESVTGVDGEDEDLHVNGFIANSLEEERPVPGLFVDQLISIEDVTEEILSATEGEGSEREKLELEAKKMQELEDEYSDEEDLYAMVVPLYNGGKFSLYGYKRYTDVRLVFVPESQAGYFGGDYDNFTFPRYNLDCSFFRVYDKDGKPLKTESYFKWSGEGIQPGEPIFVVGNPGSTNRLNTVSQLEFYRDITYPRMVEFLKSMIAAFKELAKGNPESERELNDQLLSYENSLKAYSGMLAGLRDPVLMQRKKDFEKNFNTAVQSDTELNKQYGDL